MFKVSNNLVFKGLLIPALIVIFCLAGTVTVAQELNYRGILNLNFLDYNSQLPENLLMERTVVLVEDDLANKKNSKNPAWRELAKKAHVTFQQLGIDAVAYYNLDLLLSGPTVTQSFATDIKNRAITHALLLQRDLLPSGDTLFRLTLGLMSKEDPFFAAGQKAYQTESNNLSSLLQSLTRAVSSSGLKRSNFLILEVPEFFDKTQIFTGKRFETFNPDLKLDKLAVPLFEERPLPNNVPAGVNKEEVVAQVNKENNQIKRANDRLLEIMKSYPFESEPVTFSDGEAAWRKTGNHFVLLSVHGKAETVRELLNYEERPDQPTYTSTRIVAGEPVTEELAKNENSYKFYIKHMHSGEVYLGTHWDAASTWSQALENFLLNLRASFNLETANSN